MQEALKPPQLRITLGSDRKAVILRGVDNRDHPIPCDLTLSSATQYRGLLKDGLDDMTNLVVGRRTLTVSDAASALHKHFVRASSVLFQIFNGKPSEAVHIFQECLPAWKTSSEPVTITVTADLSEWVPIELLPIFDNQKWPPISSISDLTSVARRFPGFSAIIKREFTDLGVSQDLVLENEPRLPLKYFTNDRLKAVQSELKFFQESKDIDVDGPWPLTKFKQDAFSEAVANYLQFADESFGGEPRSPIDQIHHFSCHCNVDPLAAKSLLRLSKENEVTIYQLQSVFGYGAGRTRPQPAPLIFLNACGGSIIDPMAVTSFPKFFLRDNGNRGFIGTETNIPDDFAAEFSQTFYKGLMNGVSLGRAIYDAKWRMLREKYNPLGILYTVYADPNLHVRRNPATSHV